MALGPAAPPSDTFVFINCPFDDDYAHLADAVIFTVYDCGFVARSALEVDDGAQVRIQKIFEIIAQCPLGIHDISRTELDQDSGLPRFNMPLELGIFLGAKQFGDAAQQKKRCLILDKERYRYQQFISDIAGQDIKSHDNETKRVVKVVRDWLSTNHPDRPIVPSGSKIFERYTRFLEDLPELCQDLQLDSTDLIYSDFTRLVASWLGGLPTRRG